MGSWGIRVFGIQVNQKVQCHGYIDLRCILNAGEFEKLLNRTVVLIFSFLSKTTKIHEIL